MSDETTVQEMPSKRWNMRIPWPTEWYKMMIKGASFAPSKSSDNPQITLDLEVFGPEKVQQGDYMLTVAGTPLQHYFPITVYEGDKINQQKTKEARGRFVDFCDKLGVEAPSTDEQWENPTLSHLIGIKFFVLLSAKRNEVRKDPTPEQKARGELGDILTDPITGEKSIKYYPKVEEISGRVPE